MKNISRKVLSILLIIFLLTPSVITFASYGEDSITLIEELGIAKKVNMSFFSKSYTRSDFAYMLAQLDRAYLPGVADTSVLTDVTGDNLDVIAHTVAHGYLRLDEKGKFNPDAELTYNDAVIALVTLLGYDSVAELSGGKLANYLSTARKIKLTAGIKATGDKYISQADLASMIVNSLEITPATIAYEDGAVIELPNLLDYKDMYIEEGVLLATEKRGIGADVTDPGLVNLGGKLYKTEKIFDDSYVGRSVYAYIREGQINDTVVALVNMGGESIVIEPKDITYSNVGRTYTDIKYGNKQKVRIPHTATVMVNGKPGDLTNQLFSVFNSGTLELIDSDNNGDFDTVDMTICVTEVVESASVANNTVNTKYTKRLIDFDGNDNSFTIYEGEKITDMSAIRGGSVVSIACDKFSIVSGVLTFDYANAEFIKVYVSNRKVTDVLEYTTDEGEYGIADRIYKSLPMLTTIENSGVKNKLSHGNTYAFSLDYFGNICDYEISGTENVMEYGYLLLADDNNTGFDTSAKIKVLTPSKETKIFPIRKKFVFDGAKLELGKDAFPAALLSTQLIRYKVAEGEVVEIDTAHVDALNNEVAGTSLDKFGGESALPAARNYIPNQGTIDYMFTIASDTVIYIKVRPATGEADKDENYAIGSTTDLGSINDPAEIDIYDVDDMGNIGSIVVYKDSNAADKVSRMNRTYMVEQITKAIDEAGDDIYKLTLHGYTGTVTLTTIEASEIDAKCFDYDHTDYTIAGTPIKVSNIKKGDLVRFSQNGITKKIESIERIFELETDKATYHKPRNKRSGSDTSAIQPSSSPDDPRAGAHFGYGHLYQSGETHLMFTAHNDLSNVPDSEKLLFQYKYVSRVPVYNLSDGTITIVGADYQNIPSYLSTAQDVRVFVHFNLYEVPSLAVYVMD